MPQQHRRLRLGDNRGKKGTRGQNLTSQVLDLGGFLKSALNMHEAGPSSQAQGCFSRALGRGRKCRPLSSLEEQVMAPKARQVPEQRAKALSVANPEHTIPPFSQSLRLG